MQNPKRNPKLLIFAGTSEGRDLAEAFAKRRVSCVVSVATAYGEALLKEGEYLHIRQGKKTAQEMVKMMDEEGIDAVLDATHPFATEASASIKAACKEAALPYYRLARDTEGSQKMQPVVDRPQAGVFGICYVRDMREAARILQDMQKIFVMTGSKELAKLTQVIEAERLVVRVLPSVESLQICSDCGIHPSHIIAMQGPFGTQMNVEMLKQSGAQVVLTKESGRAGGYAEKIEAARRLNLPVVVLRNPEKDSTEKTYHQQDLLSLFAPQQTRRVLHLIGIGPGDASLLTQEAAKQMREADLVCGAPSVLAHVKEEITGKIQLPVYQGRELLAFLNSHPQYLHPVVLLSGDTGLYSGANGIEEVFAKQGEIEVHRLPGISSLSYFASRIQKPYQDTAIVSAHGRSVNVRGHLCKARAMYVFAGDAASVREIGASLKDLPVRVTVGFDLSLPTEEIFSGMAAELSDCRKEGLYLLYLEQDRGDAPLFHLPDSAFLRDRVPMTKEEIRLLSLHALDLKKDSVLYDIGAGSGSIGIEAALALPDLQVYAIEEKEAALALLRKNIAHLHAEQIVVCAGKAPEALKDLPAPTHVFLGGTGGCMQEILEAVIQKNPSVRICANFIAPENLGTFLMLAKELSLRNLRIRQVQISRGEEVGSMHLLKAQNPVTIVDCIGPEGEDA